MKQNENVIYPVIGYNTTAESDNFHQFSGGFLLGNIPCVFVNF